MPDAPRDLRQKCRKLNRSRKDAARSGFTCRRSSLESPRRGCRPRHAGHPGSRIGLPRLRERWMNAPARQRLRHLCRVHGAARQRPPHGGAGIRQLCLGAARRGSSLGKQQARGGLRRPGSPIGIGCRTVVRCACPGARPGPRRATMGSAREHRQHAQPGLVLLVRRQLVWSRGQRPLRPQHALRGMFGRSPHDLWIMDLGTQDLHVRA